MAKTTAALFYSATTGRLRRVIVPDDDSQLANHLPGQGEASTTVPISALGGAVAEQAAVTKACGIVPANDRYAVCDPTQPDGNGNLPVVGAYVLDPLGCGDVILSPSDGATPCYLVPDAKASPGWVLPAAAVPAQAIAVGSPAQNKGVGMPGQPPLASPPIATSLVLASGILTAPVAPPITKGAAKVP
jgi:hypothetical protein